MFVVILNSKQMKFVLTVRLQIEQEQTSKYKSNFYARTRISIL